jgi:YidC/Oxa1 family membrane protein insertase
VSFLDTLATPVAQTLRGIHAGLSTVLPSESGWAWGLSVVFLTITVRILLFPLFVKQIKSQRRMQELAPKIKALQAKHKGDRETLNTELMKLYKDHGTNPISGCLPLLLQMPVFFALFHTLNNFTPGAPAKFGLSADFIAEGSVAKVFGAPIAAAFNDKKDVVEGTLGADLLTVQIVAAVMIVVMGATTFFTQKQMMARNGAPTDPQQQQIQKILLYVLPLSFAVFGFSFPIGVLLYWLTTNIWSMGQQYWVIKRMPPITPGATPAKPSSTSKKAAAESTTSPSEPSGAVATAVAEAPKPQAPKQGQRPASGRAAGARKNKNRKGGRR